MTAILVYEGYKLMERPQGGWRSIIGDRVVNFDTAAQWVQYINYLKHERDSSN